MGRVTRRSVASKDESTPKDTPKSGGRRGAKKDESVVEKSAGGDSQETPTRRSGRQAAKEEPKADAPTRGKSAVRGRSASRAKGKKEEEPESKEAEVEDEEEVAEEKVQKGTARSRGKGKSGQETKAANAVRGGRGAKSAEVKDKSEENEEEEEDEADKEAEQESTSVKGRGGRARSKAATVTPSPRNERRARGKAAAAEQDDEKDEDQQDGAEADTTPKGRQRRGGANKKAESIETPPSSGRRARGQKATPVVKSTPASARPSRRGAGAATEDTPDKTEQEQMETEEDKASPTAPAAEKEAPAVTNEETPEKEAAVEEAPAAANEEAAGEKEALEQKETASTEEVAMETQESVPETSTAVVAANTCETAGEQTAAETSETAGEQTAAQTSETAGEQTAAETSETAGEQTAAETSETVATEAEKGSPITQKATEVTPEPNSQASTTCNIEASKESESPQRDSPGKKRKLEDDESSPVAKRIRRDSSQLAEAEVSTEEDFVVVSKEDVPAPDSSEVIASLPPKVPAPASETPTAAAAATDDVSTEDITDPPTIETVPAEAVAPTADQKDIDETSAAAMETSSQPASDVAPGDLDAGSSAAVNSATTDQPVATQEQTTAEKLPETNTSSTPDGQSDHQDGATPAATAEPAAVTETNSSSEAAPGVSQDTQAASPTQTVPASDVSQTSPPEAMEVDAETPVENTTDSLGHPVVHQNGTDEEPALVNSDTHVTPSPDKSPAAAVRKDCIPSSAAFDVRKFVLNSTFPVELMDPAYCFTVVSYNILADCHLCRSDFSYTQPQYLTQEYRHNLLVKELDYLDGDVVCLQEVSPRYYQDKLLPVMKRFPALTVIDQHWDHAGIEDSREFYAGAENVAFPNVACAIKQLVAKAGSDQNPHIICGDFNSDATKPAYQLARDGYLSDDHILRLQAVHGLDNTDETSHALIHHMWGAFQHTSSALKNAYELTLGKEPPVTLYTKSGRSADHIFFSSSSIDNVGILETIDEEVLEASGGLPNRNLPSDHISVKAMFRLK